MLVAMPDMDAYFHASILGFMTKRFKTCLQIAVVPLLELEQCLTAYSNSGNFSIWCATAAEQLSIAFKIAMQLDNQ